MKISVIIPCYNLGEFLPESLQSARQADCDDFEIVVVDDGSTDPETLALLETLEQPPGSPVPLRLIRQENRGASEARNTGVREASGDYIMPLDADDRLRSDFLTQAASVLDAQPDIGVVYGYVQRFGDDDEVWEFPEVDEVGMLVANCVPVCALYRRQVWEDCGGYDPEMTAHEDWEFWVHAMSKGWKFHRLTQVACEYRSRQESVVRRWDVPETRKRLVQYMCRKHRDLYTRNLPEVIASRELIELELHQLVWKQEKEIEEHSRALHERIDFIDALTKAFRKVQADLEDVVKRLEEREAALTEIQGTRWWRLACLLQRLKDKIGGSPSR